ncbi:hypothetical protein [Limosilactobacillus reuteri]|uniref:hypothetical protein n=1 Tax=Limosilactobacillus reuteri TaxID=1598 RepID=UPI001E50568C|nr:hypothetical protein [Limosilactobacillus reuteri]MCC4358017.1 hypothetical protein [Limosilactobacillus reuteri]MCC4362062.1 hypothetical protein [Limosilactobacillus reuteri]MCC4363956.1 hypothetical protein [Limosilactobacillus reuteri]
MSKEEMIQEIIEISAHNMDWFIGFVGLLLAFFAYFQWRLSQSQLDRLKEEIEKQIKVKYHLDKINKIEQIDNTLIQLVLTNLRSVTNRMLFDSESYTNVSLTDKAINIIGYLSVLKNQEIKNTDFIKEIGNVFMMIDGWCNRSTKNSLGEPTKMYLYRIYVDLTRKENWQKVDGYNVAIENLKDTIRPLENFQYMDLDINDHS